MSTKKTIQINPELFKMSGQKSRRNRDKRDISINPVISPNNLKNKLLNRIKEHKTNELKQNKTHNTNPTKNGGATINTYSDEFYGAINYLSELTKKQKQQRLLHNKTIKNHSSFNNNSTNNNNYNNNNNFTDDGDFLMMNCVHFRTSL